MDKLEKLRELADKCVALRDEQLFIEQEIYYQNDRLSEINLEISKLKLEAEKIYNEMFR